MSEIINNRMYTCENVYMKEKGEKIYKNCISFLVQFPLIRLDSGSTLTSVCMPSVIWKSGWILPVGVSIIRKVIKEHRLISGWGKQWFELTSLSIKH